MKVFASKNLGLAGIALAGVMGLCQSSFAYTPAGSGQTAGPGGTNLTVFGQSFPCTSTFTVNVTSGGAATVTAAAFSTPGSAVCPFIVASGFPWTIGTATATGTAGVYTATISGITVTVKQASGTVVATCNGSVTGTLDQRTSPHKFTFTGTLSTSAPVSGQPCSVSTQPGAFLPTALTAP